MFVTAQTAERDDLRQEVLEAFQEFGLDVEARDQLLYVDGTRFALDLIGRAHPTPAAIAALTAETGHPAFLVADRISEPGREVLRRAGWGWLDRRGHLRVWLPGLRVDALLAERTDSRQLSTNPWTPVGLEVALAALLFPEQKASARHIAPVIGRSVGAVHEMVARFTAVGLVGPTTRRPLLPDLFWETAAHWPDDDWIGLDADLGEVAARAGDDRPVRVDERAATLGGARIAAAGDLPARAYIRSSSTLRRLRKLTVHGATPRCWVRRAPVEWLPVHDDLPPTDAHPWFVAHPIVCALRLAADPSRGREIVEAWGVVPGARS